jgi:hypothetical protein
MRTREVAEIARRARFVRWPHGLFDWPFGPRNPMKNSLPEVGHASACQPAARRARPRGRRIKFPPSMNATARNGVVVRVCSAAPL